MDGFKKTDKKQEIIEATWDYLLRKGLGGASVGDLCRETGLSQSSLYYWFENKDDIWIGAGKYGLAKVVEALMDFTFAHIYEAKKYFATLLDEAEKYKHEIRLAIQITTSPVFGERMRNKSKDFNMFYEMYAAKIIEEFGCTLLQAETSIYSIIAFVVDYAIWDDGEKTQMLIDNLYERTIKITGKAE